jgi:hypothetical protein
LLDSQGVIAAFPFRAGYEQIHAVDLLFKSTMPSKYKMNAVDWQQICMIGFYVGEHQYVYQNFFWFGVN